MRVMLLDVSTSGHRIEYARYLTQHFTNEGNEVYYFTCGDDDRLEQLEKMGATVHSIDKLPTIDTNLDSIKYRIELFEYYRTAFSIADEWNADVVHQLSLDSSEAILLPFLFKNANSDWKFFGTYFTQQLVCHGDSTFKKFYRVVQRSSIKTLIHSNFLNGLFTFHSDVKNELVTKLSISDNSVFSIPDPIEAPSIDLSKSNLREKLSLPPDQPILLFFGATRKSKGADILLEALTHIDTAEFTVVFAGSADSVGPKEVENARSKTHPGISIIDRFEFIPDDEVYQYFVAADAIALPYRGRYQGTSGILQRAIASGRPVIGTDYGVVSSIIKTWGTGVIAEPGSGTAFAKAIETYLSDMDYINKISGRKTAGFVKKHNWEEFADQILGVYEMKL